MVAKKKDELVSQKQEEPAQLAKRAANSVTLGFSGVAKLLSADLAPPDLTQVFSTIKTWEDNLKDLASNARERILKLLDEQGQSKSEKGSKTLDVAGWRLEVRPQKKGLNQKKVEALLRAKRYDPATYMDTQITYVMNEDKLNQAVKAGVFTEDELSSCENEPSFALQRPKRIDQDE